MFSFLNNIPPVTKNLLLINVLLYILMMVSISTNGPDLTNYLSAHYVMTPFFEPYQIVTHMFMHSSFLITHIFFNMFILVIFGSHLERIWGAKHYFIFYFACGLGAFALDNIVHGIEIYNLKETLIAKGVNMVSFDNLIEKISFLSQAESGEIQNELFGGKDVTYEAQRYFNLSTTSGVGASGALFGLLAAFAILFPNTELYLMFLPIPIKAKYFIGFYVLYELYMALNPVSGDFTNHLAHLGGALVGAIIVIVRRKTNKTNFY